jgi:hypothetical protein
MTSNDQEAREQALHAQLVQAREKLDGLAQNLRAIDGELEGLSTERQQYDLLHAACSALEQLGELGAAHLFWGERVAAGEGNGLLRLVRGRVDVFQKRLSEIEERRQAVVEEIEQQQEGTEFLEEDYFQAQQQAEQRRLEWVIEREIEFFPVRQLIMPWTRGGEEDQRFRKSLRIALLVCLLVALLIPMIEIPLPELGEGPPEMPERLTRLIAEPRKLPPPPIKQEETKPEPQPTEELAEQTPPDHPTKPKEGPGEGPGVGPGSGPGTGILAFREKFSAFQENQALARLGASAHINTAGAAPSGVVERSMVTTSAPGSSGGINLSELSRNVAGGGGGAGGRIAGVQVARATSTIAGGGGGGGRGQSVGGGGPGLSRTDEEIQIVFDRHKSALYRLYNRELRNDPTLKGQMVLRIRIEPDGRVTLCELQGTDMRAPQLVAQVLERVKTFDFGAKDGIPAVTILYPIDFLPAS